MTIVLNALVNTLLPGAALTGLVLLALRLVPWTNAATRYMIWLATLLTVVSFAALPGRRTTPERSRPPVVLGDLSLQASVPALQPTPPSQRLTFSQETRVETWRWAAAPPSRRNWTGPLFGAWLAVALAMLARVAAGCLQLHRLRQAAQPAPAAWQSRSPLPVLLSDGVRAPVAAGLGTPAILLPRRLAVELSPEELDQVLAHEAAHLRRRDDLTNLVQKLVEAVLFFHPAVWFIGRRLNLEREVACDDWVLAGGAGARDYASCLTRLAERSLPPGPLLASAALGPSQISVRIDMLLDHTRNITTRCSGRLALSLLAAVAVAAPLLAQLPAPFPVQAPPRARTDVDPGRREKARELLDSASKMVSSVQPQVRVAALLHLGDNYTLVDRKKAQEALEQAFTAAADLPSSGREDPRGQIQSMIVTRMADVSLTRAKQLVGQLPPASRDLPDPRIPAVEKIVGLLLDRKEFDEAMELVETAGASGEYPFRAARLIFERLPDDDGRRSQVFAAASAAFAGRPRGAFAEFLSRHYQAVPRPAAEAALQAVLNSILDRRDDTPTAANISTSKGTASFSSRQDRELFDIMHVVKALDPKRADEILQKRPELRAAVERFPLGMDSMRGDQSEIIAISVRDGASRDPKADAEQQGLALASSRAAEAVQAARKDPQRALALAKTIPIPAVQVGALGSIVRAAGDKDPATAKSVLDQVSRLLDDIKRPAERAQAWETLAEAAHRAKEEKRAWDALDRGLSDAAELYKQDTDAERGNEALREYWPSTQSFRRLLHKAASLFGPEAESLLVKISDPELALLARIEIARALLGRTSSATMVRVMPRGEERMRQEQQRRGP
jgi:beta-lactamase regulating signal transducer with metallopeptidase domain